MTREEQILNKAIDYSEIEENFLEYDDCGDVCDDKDFVEKAFIEGAKWSDEHPNLYNMKLWIVRIKTGELIINLKCPYYHKHLESWCGGEPIGYFDNYMFPEVTFENSPQEVELKLKNL